jgi:hypothetical protein
MADVKDMRKKVRADFVKEQENVLKTIDAELKTMENTVTDADPKAKIDHVERIKRVQQDSAVCRAKLAEVVKANDLLWENTGDALKKMIVQLQADVEAVKK